MLQNILNLEGVKTLERSEKGTINGGFNGIPQGCETCPGSCRPNPCQPESFVCYSPTDPTLICLEP
ncbi:hypothetical protein [Aquimarina algiphila]|uniref:hypothetical protein n=1 Tax=Aquimarina algiphila TaxID=2047982 RepID=UPI00232EAE15|nr:hypothetical protein [Aquimarina algiphila]